MIPCTHCDGRYQFRPKDMVDHLNAHAKVWMEKVGTDDKIKQLSLHQFSNTKDHDLWWKKLKSADRALLDGFKLDEAPSILNLHSLNFLNAIEAGPVREFWKALLEMLATQLGTDVCTGVVSKKNSNTITFARPLVVFVDDAGADIVLKFDKELKLTFAENEMKIDSGVKAFIIEPVLSSMKVKKIAIQGESTKITVGKKMFDKSGRIPTEQLFKAIQASSIVEEGISPEAELERRRVEVDKKLHFDIYTSPKLKHRVTLNEHSMKFLALMKDPKMLQVWKDQLLLFADKFEKDCCIGFSEKKGVYTLAFDRDMAIHVALDQYVNAKNDSAIPSGMVLSMGKKFQFEIEGSSIHVKSTYKAFYVEPFRFSVSVVGLTFGETGIKLDIQKLKIPFSYVMSYDELSDELAYATILEPGTDPKKFLSKLQKAGANTQQFLSLIRSKLPNVPELEYTLEDLLGRLYTIYGNDLCEGVEVEKNGNYTLKFSHPMKLFVENPLKGMKVTDNTAAMELAKKILADGLIILIDKELKFSIVESKFELKSGLDVKVSSLLTTFSIKYAIETRKNSVWVEGGFWKLMRGVELSYETFEKNLLDNSEFLEQQTIIGLDASVDAADFLKDRRKERKAAIKK